MNLSQILQSIEKVKANNRVNIILELNNDYSLLVEGSFSVKQGSEQLVHSNEYVYSNFSKEVLGKIQFSLENTGISSATFSEETGKLALELENGVTFESFFIEGDYASWELCKNGRAIYGSECGSIIHY